MNKRLVTLIAGVLIALLIVVGIVAVMVSGMKGKEEGISVSADDIQVSIMTTTQAEEEPPAVVTIPEEEKTTDEPEEEVISYFFRTDKQYEEHYQKHGAEFGDITKEQYLEMANELIGSSSETVLHKIEQEDGDYIYYDTENNEILFLSKDGYIRTFFKPTDGIDYFNRQ